jgi:diguanylate cyclase (GGDEF)-like protein
MNTPLGIISNGLVMAGLLVLLAALIPLLKLVNLLPAGQVRKKWYLQTGLIIVFIVGYLGFLVTDWNNPDFIVPGIFLFGAAYVWMTINLSLETALDIRRVTVLEEENITDPLIGIYNRRYMDKRLEEEFKRAKRYNLPLSLLLVDIDFFKEVNDSFGHPVGDMVLRHWGGLILSAVRASDIVVRYGGDEVLVILPGAALTASYNLAERIRKNIESHEIILDDELGNKRSILFSVSIGVACLTPKLGQVGELLKEADRALYLAKTRGRNCVVQCDDVLPNVTTG